MVLFGPMTYAEDSTIARILKDCRTIAVVGLSSNPARPSYRVASYMQAQGCHIIPVNPNETSVLGEKANPLLAAVPDAIDLVDIFRRAEDVPPIIEEAIAKKVKAVWLQEGIVNEPAATRAQSTGLLVLVDRCSLKEHSAE